MSVKRETSLQATRDMLDELDTLMERMLSLPLSGDGTGEASDPVPAALAARLTLLEPSAVALSDEALPAAADEQSLYSVRRRVASPRAVQAAMSVPRAQEPEPIAVTVPPPSLLPRLERMMHEVPEPAPAPELRWLLPLLWCNDLFERSTHALGWFGWLLRTGFGRNMLGAAGLGLICYTVACLVKEWLGWT